ncbi:hypothetical protein L596_030287 [Steinernema carpocapsae]|uniref:Uncharacterized protein n=1 Tax=Steinernema carpocapsae TaxID=34508 RepID=A0A4U5LNY6_STECR|nr:hypothetical protein L596_030287 [Steinernema carpocapsae]
MMLLTRKTKASAVKCAVKSTIILDLRTTHMLREPNPLQGSSPSLAVIVKIPQVFEDDVFLTSKPAPSPRLTSPRTTTANANSTANLLRFEGFTVDQLYALAGHLAKFNVNFLTAEDKSWVEKYPSAMATCGPTTSSGQRPLKALLPPSLRPLSTGRSSTK